MNNCIEEIRYFWVIDVNIRGRLLIFYANLNMYGYLSHVNKASKLSLDSFFIIQLIERKANRIFTFLKTELNLTVGRQFVKIYFKTFIACLLFSSILWSESSNQTLKYSWTRVIFVSCINHEV